MAGESHIRHLAKGQRETLTDSTSEVNARMYILAKDELDVVEVDRGVIEAQTGTKKCDFLVLGTNTDQTHFVELKGRNIDAAFRQITSTIDSLNESSDYCSWVKNRVRMDSYIVSPERQRVPEIHSPAETELAKKLARCKGQRVKDIYSLIMFVKVVPKQNKLSINGRNIISSGKAPVELA